ncbi:hypothetical protein JL193_03890 [Polaribacter batillariae]|uniref:Uncharacterized protein n=1 Tax=Polaribacter batillariae TaxID=2808900 RepID=A0ABX7T097_9FLAO|nr:hypothetical protein [Polaribacter batillariae]QTD38444.1 hypothetical protein JL193_03890 [Polaribacter batillariae]
MKKNKVVSLLNHKTNEGKNVKYSSLLEEFIEPFASEFQYFEYQEDIFDFAISAWNFANMSFIVDKNEFERTISLIKDEIANYPLLKKMIQHKQTNFKEFKNFIIDFELYEKNNSLTLTVVTQKEEVYLSNHQELEKTFIETEFNQNYINRSAISLKPLQPFIDWYNKVHPNDKIDETDVDEVNIYLINSNYYDDIETYLKKKFDIYFKIELEDWFDDRKNWPKKRTYKMFKQWFRVDVSNAIYDLEKVPVKKIE